MSYHVISEIPNAEFKIEIDQSEFDDIDELEELLSEWLFDLARKAWSSYQIQPIGVFSEEEITKSFIQQANEYILSRKDEWYITLEEVDNSNTIISSEKIDATQFVSHIIEDMSGSGEFCAQVGKYVEDCIQAYCRFSIWHIEKDRMWFAPKETIPQKPWIIDTKSSEYEFNFWFGEDTWELMEYIGDFGEVFLIWYCAECGFCPPDMDAIMKKCPINIEENETVESLIKKCKKYCEIDQDKINDLLEEALEQYVPVPMGKFNIYEIEDHMYERAHQYLYEKFRGVNCCFEKLDNKESMEYSCFGNLSEYLKESLAEREISEQSSCDVGGYVDQALRLFQEKSTWNVGLLGSEGICTDASLWPEPVMINGKIFWKKGEENLKPLLWYGIEGELPIKQWMVNSAESNSMFWFANDVDQEMESLLSEPDEGFLIWYFVECCNFFPDLKEIIENCPISICEEDSDEQILDKINELMIGLYTKSRLADGKCY